MNEAGQGKLPSPEEVDSLLHGISRALGLGLQLLSLEPAQAELTSAMGPKAYVPT